MRPILFVILAPLAAFWIIKLLPFIIAGAAVWAYTEAKKKEEEEIWNDPERW